ncbi:MAG: polynucleotide kinase-phosphatase [Alphaproteobacteria bacterium]|nr:polynucleotide kinase-phosphatase [Alphaproteobacteria bacterium]
MPETQAVSIPDFCLVVLVGASGSGKSTFARRHFLETEIISSDNCRGLIMDDETDQSATTDAFDLIHHMAGLRLKNRRLTVIDSTAARKEDRAQLVALARKWHAPVVALVLDIDPEICHARNAGRDNRNFGEQVPRNHSRMIRRGLRNFKFEGFSDWHVMRDEAAVEAVEIVREPLWTDLRKEHGPFDIIGDVHGCFDELTALLAQLGYQVDDYEQGETLFNAFHPDGRIAFFVGDLCDRGPRNVDVLRLVMGMAAAGTARCVIGNHDFKLLKWLRGKKTTLTHGLDLTVAELEQTSEEFRRSVREFIFSLRSHAWLDDGNLVVVHAGLKEEMHGRGSGALRSFAMFGDTTGEVDEFGLPVRLEWARDYRGRAAVVFGHTPTREAQWLNGTLCIDTGCVFGGTLTALRWPEKELVALPALKEYAEPARPLDTDTGAFGDGQLIYFDELIGKQRIETRFKSTIIVPEQNAAAALEITSRFGIDPRWLIHLPPTMAPCPTAPEGPFLEHPDQALDAYNKEGIEEVVAQEKHMGSRSLLVVCRDGEAAARRFRVEDGKAGVIYTRTGRPFFRSDEMEAMLVDRVGSAIGKAGLWDELDSDWLLIDAELMPWSAKAQDLLRQQYGPTAVAARASVEALQDALARAASNAGELDELKAKVAGGIERAERFEQALKGYCWEAASLDDYRLAPFHLLASEGHVYDGEPHSWHMQTLARICAHDPILQETTWRALSTSSSDDRAALIDWWIGHTDAGGEGMVIKPSTFIARGERRMVQPAMKVRGRNYLSIIYGPDYDAPHNLDRLRKRGLKRKWTMAMREFALGLEGLHSFVEGAPLARAHQCALAILALESEPVDPRL